MYTVLLKACDIYIYTYKHIHVDIHLSIYTHNIYLYMYKVLFKDYKSKCISYYLKQTDQGDGLSAFNNIY